MSRLILKYTNNLSRSKPAVSVLLDVCSHNAVNSSRYSSTLCEMSRLSPLICRTMLYRRQLICHGLTNNKIIKKYWTQKTEDDVPFLVKVHGIPNPVDAKKVLSFLGDSVDVVGGEKGVHLEDLNKGERPAAFVEVVDEKSFDNALQKDKESISSGYVRVYRSNKTLMDIYLRRGDLYQSGCLVKVTDFPPNCSTTEIAEVFEGLEVVPGGIYRDGISTKRSKSIAYVQFASQEMAKKALLRNFDRINDSLIVVGPCSPSVMMDGSISEEMIEKQSLEESTGNRTIHSVYMTWLPDTADIDEIDIENFFAQRKVKPVRIEIRLRKNGLSADAVVFFKSCFEVWKAMKVSNLYIGQHLTRVTKLRANPMDGTLIKRTRKIRQIRDTEPLRKKLIHNNSEIE